MKKILFTLVLLFSFIFITTGYMEAKMTTTQVRAEHILVNSESQAKELKSKIESNEISFEDAAKQYSKCPSGANGGDLGYFSKGMMVKEFEEAAFSIEENKVSEPIQTQFGWHLIKVIDKK